MGSGNPKALRGISPQTVYPTLAAYCPDLAEWPQRWRYEDRDLELGEALLESFTPFLLELLGSTLSRKTLCKHRDNLWLLGGEIIRRIQDEPELRKRPVKETLLELLDDDYGPLLYPPVEEEQQRAFDATCRKLRNFLIPAAARKR